MTSPWPMPAAAAGPLAMAPLMAAPWVLAADAEVSTSTPRKAVAPMWTVFDALPPRIWLAIEMAFTTVDPYQGRGLGTLLLGVLGATAVEAGITTLVAHVMEDNIPMRRVFAKAGGNTRFDEPGLVLVSVEPERAAQLLDADVRRRIAESVHDVVTAASLALRV